MRNRFLLLGMTLSLVLIGCDTCKDACAKTARCYADEYGQGDEQKTSCLEECDASPTACLKCDTILNAGEVKDRCNQKCEDSQTQCIDCIMRASCEEIVKGSKCAGECL